jgi:hypothetical protein
MIALSKEMATKVMEEEIMIVVMAPIDFRTP